MIRIKTKERKVKIPAHIGSLEGQIALPVSDSNKLALLFLHPHPLYGGTMSNNVIRALYKQAVRLRIPSLRFNFRGVGSSEGSYSGGLGEIIDAWDAVHYLWNETKPERIGIVGYSFGAVIGGALLHEKYLPDKLDGPAGKAGGNGPIDDDLARIIRDKIAFYVGISYPAVLIPKFIDALKSPVNKYFIIGTADNFTDIRSFNAFYEKIRPPKEKTIIEGADHFWQGYENDLIDKIYAIVAKFQNF